MQDGTGTRGRNAHNLVRRVDAEPDKKEELVNALNQLIVPILKEQPGFVETLVFVPESKTDRMKSVTFRTEKRFAQDSFDLRANSLGGSLSGSILNDQIYCGMTEADRTTTRSSAHT